MNKHVMIDIETIGQSSNAPILAIGAIVFEMDQPIPRVDFDTNIPYIYKETDWWFFSNVQLQSCLDVGMIVDANTLIWWMHQADKIRSLMFNFQEQAKPIIDVLHGFREWMEKQRKNAENIYVWSHGATFDIVIMSEAYRTIGMLPPWHYRNARDTRTLYHILKDYKINVPHCIEFADLKHHPLFDAYRQAVDVQKSMEMLYSRTYRPILGG